MASPPTRLIVIVGAAGVGKSSITKRHLQRLEDESKGKTIFESVDKIVELISFSLKRDERSGEDYDTFRRLGLTRSIEEDIERYAQREHYNFAFETTGRNIDARWIEWLEELRKQFDEINLVVIKADKEAVWRRVLGRAQESAEREEWSDDWDRVYGENIPKLLAAVRFDEVTAYDNSGAPGEERIIFHERKLYMHSRIRW